jgi:anti-anti-sigma factor
MHYQTGLETAGVFMRLESQIREGVCVLRLQGRFVTGSDAELTSAQSLLREAGIVNAVIDLSAVPYVDSTGLGFVVELHKSIVGRGGQLFLVVCGAVLLLAVGSDRTDPIPADLAVPIAFSYRRYRGRRRAGIGVGDRYSSRAGLAAGLVFRANLIEVNIVQHPSGCNRYDSRRRPSADLIVVRYHARTGL